MMMPVAFYLNQSGARLHLVDRFPTRDHPIYTYCVGRLERDNEYRTIWNRAPWRSVNPRNLIPRIVETFFLDDTEELDNQIDAHPMCRICLATLDNNVAHLTVTLEALAR